jgi:uncharacterized protein
MTDRRPRALVTGATSGIGAAFARQLAATGHDLVLVARDTERLDAMAAELAGAHGGEATTLPADLTTPEGVASVEKLIGSEHLDLLVNNAGMSINRPFLRSTPELEEKLLALNVTAVLRLTLAATQAMTARGSGGVINVSSVSGFAAVMPGSTYPASKAWVTAFSESVGLSARAFGVRVMALCPGYTRTEFHSRAGINMSKTPRYMWLDATAVVAAALRDYRRGKLVSVPDWRYKIAAFGMRHAPRRLLQGVAKDTRGRIGRDQ